ncbi:MAG: tetratricopeptide repeat protein [Deltaproteobacteria bacterium]|nr:tetratricopeptide repeat protein [Deltaproteobacteria bacterium]
MAEETLAPENVRWRGFEAAIFTVLILAASVAAQRRNAAWRDEFSLWSDVSVKSPHELRGHNNAASALIDAGLYREAIPYIKKAIEIDPRYGEPHYNLGVAYMETGFPDAAAAELEEFLRISAFTERGHFRQGDYSRSYVIKAHAGLGNIYNLRRDYGLAISHFTEALEFAPAETSIRFNLAITYKMAGLKDDAAREFEEVLRLDPSDEGARWNLERLKGR